MESTNIGINELDENNNDQIDEIVKIVKRLAEKSSNQDYSEKLKHKISFTPPNDFLELNRSELKMIQKKLLRCNEDLQESVMNSIDTIRHYILSNRNPEKYPESFRESYVWYYDRWIEEFILNLASTLEYPMLEFPLFSDLLKINELEINDEEIDDYFYLEDYADFPEVIELIDCINLISYFEFVFESYHDILDGKIGSVNENPSKKNQLSGFKIGLTTDQINNLFESLVRGKFIPANTNKDCFNWSFGDLNVKESEQWKPITWNEAKQGLRELLKPILGIITNQHIRDIEQLFCDKNGRPFRMSKPKKDDNSARCTDIEKILTSIDIKK